MTTPLSKLAVTSSVYHVTNAQALRLTGGAGVDRDREEKEDLPVLTNDLPTSSPATAITRHRKG